MGNETVAVYDPRLLDDIPAWVIENIQAVSAYMKTRGHEDWTIAGVRSQAAHAREVGSLQERIDNLEASGVHTCGVHCKRPVCVMRRRAEAAEAELSKFRATYAEVKNAI